MAHQALYRNKLILALIFIAAMSACTNIPASMGRVQINDAQLKHGGGTLYYKNVPFTGTAFELYENGDTAKSLAYVSGKQHGPTCWWYPNKQLAQKRVFINGWKQGTHTGWWPDGKVQFVYHFTNDEYEGEVTEWYKTGKVFRVFHYAAGHEAGSQKMWWEDGKIRANYVIINGEKFGLFGQKMCVNDLKI